MRLLIHQFGHSLANKAIHRPRKDINNRSKNPEIMEMSSSDISNNEIGILLDQSEAGKITKASKPILNNIITYFAPKSP